MLDQSKRRLFSISMLAACLLPALVACSNVPPKPIKMGDCSSDCTDTKFRLSKTILLERFPQIKPTDEVWFVDSRSMMGPQLIIVKYVPEVVSDHGEIAKAIVCRPSGDELQCEADIETKYFLDDPKSGFAKTNNISVDEAMQVARLYAAGRFLDMDGKPAKIRPDLQIGDMQRGKDGLILHVVSGACGGPIAVSVLGSGDTAFLQIGPVQLNCI